MIYTCLLYTSTMLDAVKKYSGVDFNEIHSDEEAKAIAKEKGVEFRCV